MFLTETQSPLELIKHVIWLFAIDPRALQLFDQVLILLLHGFLLHIIHRGGELDAALLAIATMGIKVLSIDMLYKLFGALLVFQIRLTVKVLCFNVCDPLRRGAVQQYQVGREELILHDLHNHTNLHVTPNDLLELAGLWIRDHHLSIVLHAIALVPFHVLKNIFDHRN